MKNPYSIRLESKRLIARKLDDHDVATWADFFADPESMVYLPKNNLDSNTAKAREWIDRQLNRYHANEFGLLALIEKETGKLVEQGGLLVQEIDGKKELEVGYHVLKTYRGKGYASEAAKLFIDYAFENKLTYSVISIIETRNTNSQRVAEKNGLKKEKQIKWKDMDVYIYRIEHHA